METSKEEMMMLLRELQDLQTWLLNRGSKLSLIVTFCGNLKIISKVVYSRGLTYRNVEVTENKSYNENLYNLKDFMDYVTKLEYGCEKGKPNQTPT